MALRCSCRSAICGSCAMRINGHAKLACNTKVSDVAEDGGTVTVEPMGVMPVIKDLVVDQTLFWDKVRQVSPWLQPEGEEPEAEYLAPNSDMTHLAGVMACIMCGACVSDCTVLEMDPNFIGPAALAKAYRFAADPRDDQDASRSGGAEPVRRRLGLHPLLRVRGGVPQGGRANGQNHGAERQGHGGGIHEQQWSATHGRLRAVGVTQRSIERADAANQVVWNTESAGAVEHGAGGHSGADASEDPPNHPQVGAWGGQGAAVGKERQRRAAGRVACVG